MKIELFNKILNMLYAFIKDNNYRILRFTLENPNISIQLEHLPSSIMVEHVALEITEMVNNREDYSAMKFILYNTDNQGKIWEVLLSNSATKREPNDYWGTNSYNYEEKEKGYEDLNQTLDVINKHNYLNFVFIDKYVKEITNQIDLLILEYL